MNYNIKIYIYIFKYIYIYYNYFLIFLNYYEYRSRLIENYFSFQNFDKNIHIILKKLFYRIIKIIYFIKL